MISSNGNEISDESWQIEPYEALAFLEEGGETVPARIANEESIASNVDYITKFVRNVLNTRGPLLSLMPVEKRHPNRANTVSVRATEGGECFLKCLQMNLDRIIDKYPDIGSANRYFGIFYEAVMQEVAFPNCVASLAEVARFDWLSGGNRERFPDEGLALMVRYANEAVEQIRRNGRSRKFKKWLAAIERQPRENLDRLLSLIDACLSTNHHILVLRFDLGYGQFYCDPELAGAQTVSYEEMREHRVALRRFLKRDLKNLLLPGACKGMVFAIKMEFGLDKAYHFHVIVILNGDVVRKDGGITEVICGRWKRDITKGKGGACNCNLRRYKRKGIGSIKHWETEKLRILKETVAPYITKVDFYGKMVKPDGHRTFWPSHPSMIAPTPKGRKRMEL